MNAPICPRKLCTDHSTLTPAAIDGRIAELGEEVAKLMRRIEIAQKERALLSDEFNRRGGWSRAYFVNNVDGHLHNSMSCSSLHYSTSLTWLTEHSGKSQEEIIELAGWRACTICFADAPLGYENKPSQLKSDEDVAREERRQEREQKSAAKDEKAVRDGDGKVIFKTERTAEIEIVDHLYEIHNLTVMEAEDESHRAHLDGLRGEYADKARTFAELLAAKRGVDRDEVLRPLVSKADAKVVRLAKDWNKDPRSNSDWAKKAIVPAKGAAAEVIRKHL